MESPSPQIRDNSLSTAERLELGFPVLSDVGNAVARDDGLVISLAEDLRPIYAGWGLDLPAANGDESFGLPLPATFVIGTDAKVAWRFADADYTQAGRARRRDRRPGGPVSKPGTRRGASRPISGENG